MAKLIDDEVVKEYLKRVIWGADRKIDKWVDVMPAVDAMPVVRCKDCKHCYFAANRVPSQQSLVCDKSGKNVTDDWFCADGERRDDDAAD